MEFKRSKTFWRIFLDQKTPVGPKKYQRGALRGAQPTWVHPRTASLLYKYLENPKTLGESTKHNSSHRKFQKHQIQLDTITEEFIILIGASPMMRD